MWFTGAGGGGLRNRCRAAATFNNEMSNSSLFVRFMSRKRAENVRRINPKVPIREAYAISNDLYYLLQGHGPLTVPNTWLRAQEAGINSIDPRSRLLLPPRVTHYTSSPNLTPIAAPFPPKLRFFSSEYPTTTPDSSPTDPSTNKVLNVEDVSKTELKSRIDKYFNEGDEEALPGVIQGLLQRRLVGKHEDTDDELLEQLETLPVKDDVKDEEFESDFEEGYSTEEELDDLYNAPEYVIHKLRKNENFNMDDNKWDDLIQRGVKNGHLEDTKECEAVLEDMLHWDKLLPDDLKEKVEAKFCELGDKCETGELEPQVAYELYKEFQDEMVVQYGNQLEAEGPPKFDESDASDKNTDLDDPPGEGPILRWQSRIVFVPGGDAWHPKNRKVKLSVTVKELGLSKLQARRLRELVGKRYNSGKDELTITSERFEHREENRKDCLRTLYALIEEAAKAKKIAEDLRTAYVKQRLQHNPAFMERLQAKIQKSKESGATSA